MRACAVALPGVPLCMCAHAWACTLLWECTDVHAWAYLSAYVCMHHGTCARTSLLTNPPSSQREGAACLNPYPPPQPGLNWARLGRVGGGCRG